MEKFPLKEQFTQNEDSSHHLLTSMHKTFLKLHDKTDWSRWWLVSKRPKMATYCSSGLIQGSKFEICGVQSLQIPNLKTFLVFFFFMFRCEAPETFCRLRNLTWLSSNMEVRLKVQSVSLQSQLVECWCVKMTTDLTYIPKVSARTETQNFSIVSQTSPLKSVFLTSSRNRNESSCLRCCTQSYRSHLDDWEPSSTSVWGRSLRRFTDQGVFIHTFRGWFRSYFE